MEVLETLGLLMGALEQVSDQETQLQPFLMIEVVKAK